MSVVEIKHNAGRYSDEVIDFFPLILILYKKYKFSRISHIIDALFSQFAFPLIEDSEFSINHIL